MPKAAPGRADIFYRRQQTNQPTRAGVAGGGWFGPFAQTYLFVFVCVPGLLELSAAAQNGLGGLSFFLSFYLSVSIFL